MSSPPFDLEGSVSAAADHHYVYSGSFVPNESCLPSFVDHTLLKLDATESQIRTLCTEAVQYHFTAVCVRLKWAKLCVELLANSDIHIACVIDFHLGTASAKDKAVEAETAINEGANELDLVIDYPALLRGEYNVVWDGIARVRKAAEQAATLPGDNRDSNKTTAERSGKDSAQAMHEGRPKPKVLVKTIIETSQLTRDDIVAACVIAKSAGADCVKTSTGFNGPGAKVDDVRLMKAVVGEDVMVKASGGVRTVEDALKMIEAGAGRIGTSNGVGIMQEVERGAKKEERGEELKSALSAEKSTVPEY